MKQNIILVGFMGVGKGTVAREISKHTDFYAIDTDDLIESLENRKIKKIFKEEGEEYFRNLEKKTAKWLAKNVKCTVISTGGGFFKVPNLHKIGKVIYLKSSFGAIIKRIKEHPNSKNKIKKRPLLKDMDKAKKLFEQRVLDYENCADIIVNVEAKSVKEVAKEIIKKAKIEKKD